MSQVIRDAVVQLRAVVDKIDTRLAELQAEHTTLIENRVALVAIIEGPSQIPDSRDLDTITADEWRAASPSQREAFISREARKGQVSFRCLSCGFPTARGQAVCVACSSGCQCGRTDAHRHLDDGQIVSVPVPPSEVRHVTEAPPPAASVPPPASPSIAGLRRIDAADRIDAAVAKADTEGARYLDLARASKLGHSSAKRLVADMVATGRLTRIGKTAATRFFLPSGRAKRGAAAASAGTGSPADDDAHGAVQDVTSAGAAGVTDAPMEDDHFQQPVVRPPVDDKHDGHIGDLPPDDLFAESLAKGSIAHVLETEDDDDGLLDLDTLESSPVDDDLDAFEDAQLDLDAEPCRAKPGPKPKYKPGHRHLPAARGAAALAGSWWMRPDANFAAEAERMRLAPPSRSSSVPSANHIISMKAVF